MEYNGGKIDVRAYEKIVYVANPVDTAYQVMNIYIPEAYFNGKSINGYTTETAPIFFPNQIGAYMPAKPASTKNNGSWRNDASNGRKQWSASSGHEGLMADLRWEMVAQWEILAREKIQFWSLFPKDILWLLPVPEAVPTRISKAYFMAKLLPGLLI
ncbi:MAG: hypothetical protein MZV63_70420 [Marinilabiliales bacterium]|nr:hypothetical protein [Marinilabiliales bacterium]